MTAEPQGGLPVTVPVLRNGPSTAVPDAVQVMISPTAREVLGHVTSAPGLSLTCTPVRGTLPVLVTA